MPKTCPKCQKVIKDLSSHLARIHKLKPDLTPLESMDNSGSNQAQKAETLHIQKPARKAQKVVYHCVDCGAEFEGKLDACPNCGINFNWEGIYHA